LTSSLGATVAEVSQEKVVFEITNPSGLNLTIAADAETSNTDESAFISTATTAQTIRADQSNDGIVNLVLDVASTEAGSVTVRSWIDSDADRIVDAGEFVSDLRTVTFTKLADVTFTTTLTQPVLGDTKLAAAVAFSNDINAAQVSSQVDIAFGTKAGSTYTAATGSTVTSNAFSAGAAATYAAATNTLTAESTDDPAVSTTYVAQALITVTGGSLALKGTESVKAVAAATVTKLTTPSITASDDLKQSTVTITARNGVTALTLSSQAYLAYTNSTTNTKAAAGQTVKVTVTEKASNANTDAAKFVAGGKTLQDTTAGSDYIEFTVTTDADGKVSIPVTVSGTVAGTDSITVAVAAQNATAVADGLTTTINFADATVADDALVAANQIGSSAIYKKVAGSASTLKFAAVDSFGKGLGDTYRVLLTESGADPDVITSAVFSNGVASFSVTDSASVSEVYTAQLQKYSSTTQTWSSEYASSNNFDTVAVTPVVGTSEAVAKVDTLVSTPSYTSGGSSAAYLLLALNGEALAAADTRSGGDAPTVLTAANSAAGNVSTLSGTVLDASGIGTYSDVTLSAAGALFVANGVYALGSITVQTDAVGAFGGVKIYSNKSGDTVVTATANGKTKTLTVTFADAAKTAGATVALSAPAYATPGSTLTITPTSVDKWGNKVAADVVFEYTGPGLPIAAASTITAANTAFRVLLGAGDSGTATVTAWIDTNDDSVKDSGETFTASITIGAAPAAAATAAVSGSTGKFFVSATAAAGKSVVVKVAGKFVTSFKATGSKKSVAVKATKGSKKVTVFVGGKLVATKTVTVK
jgi:hypothetical protein